MTLRRAQRSTPYVTDTAVTFESVPPLPLEMAARIATAGRTHAWVVLEDQGRVVGYAYASPFKSRAGYRWTCEVSVYLERDRRRTGGGRALYEALFVRLIDRGFRTAVAGMTLPNDASVGLHLAMGFELVGTYRRIGWKHGTWHDVAWVQRTFATGQDPPVNTPVTCPDTHGLRTPARGTVGCRQTSSRWGTPRSRWDQRSVSAGLITNVLSSVAQTAATEIVDGCDQRRRAC